ncbi:type III-B CRISPR module-associated Cmr3 family protein [Paenibacillus dendritiformis]|uniref:type III-B CRISPR module-associated Cmr3 family protein n=1 Tax=Paenibacillus dendritiformis TaxID=130049 RepID=UPI000DAA8E8D|nr:type III-B CRISPR module-associated Cmr3 family protein [Paenibacillus dendritiformis]PZM66781.1 hypothetical protein DOE73_05050 [Paenibacillus dendritiformis]
MLYAIDAVDTLFFRNGAPFDAGLNHAASSAFPPLPSVYAGALRTGGLSLGRSDQNAARRIKIGFSGLMAGNQFLFPRPLDSVVWKQEGSKWLLKLLRLTPAPISSAPLEWGLSAEPSGSKEVAPRGGGYISENELQAYLEGNEWNCSVQALADYIHDERHIGIQIDPASGAARDRRWYSIHKVRPADQQNRKCSLVVEAEGLSISQPTVIKIGGESKTASLYPIEQCFSLPPVADTGRLFKLYLATPAIFKQGWLPWWIDPATMEGWFAYKKRRIRVRLLSAAVGRYVPVGGFGTFEHNGKFKSKPREMRYAVPAGSVYFFQIVDGTFEDANKLFHQKCISDYRENLGFVYDNWDRLRYCDRGFGYSLIGRIGEEQGGMIPCTK